jgi:hypothetical protein
MLGNWPFTLIVIMPVNKRIAVMIQGRRHRAHVSAVLIASGCQMPLLRAGRRNVQIAQMLVALDHRQRAMRQERP